MTAAVYVLSALAILLSFVTFRILRQPRNQPLGNDPYRSSFGDVARTSDFESNHSGGFTR